MATDSSKTREAGDMTYPQKKAARFRLLFALWDVMRQIYTTSALVMTTGSVGTSSW